MSTTSQALKFLIVRLGSLGDLVHAVPAVTALRAEYPAATIDWLVEPVHAGLLSLVPAVDTVVSLRGRSVSGWLATRRVLRAERYDVALDLQGLVKSAALAWLTGARSVVGFDTAALREPAARFFYTRQVAVGEGRHVIDKNLALVADLAPAATATRVTGRFAENSLRLQPSQAREALRREGVGEYVLLNPGAAWPNKRWPPAAFAEVARWVHGEYGWTSVVLWGPGEEPTARAIAEAAGGCAQVAPATTFNDVLALSRDARLMLSGDTGPLHLAAAMGSPIVALFGPTSAGRNGPWDDRDVSISRYDHCACHYQRECRTPATWCLATITINEVQAAITCRITSAKERSSG